MPPPTSDRSPRVQRWVEKLVGVKAEIAQIQAYYERIKASAPGTEVAKGRQRLFATELAAEAESYKPVVKYYEDRIREDGEIEDLELVSVGKPAASTAQSTNGTSKS
ncbi:MAG: hypothetical protein Q7R67_00405 [bacterium]|nr:hypothetical protein [bacterium]